MSKNPQKRHQIMSNKAVVRLDFPNELVTLNDSGRHTKKRERQHQARVSRATGNTSAKIKAALHSGLSRLLC